MAGRRRELRVSESVPATTTHLAAAMTSGSPSGKPAPAGSRRAIPSVERIRHALGQTGLPRPLVTAAVREHLADLRQKGEAHALDRILSDLRAVLDRLRQSRIQPVINGTGVVIHTNLGRSPLPPMVAQAVAAIASGYSNLEYDLAGGGRGARAGYVEMALAHLSGAGAATVVNNCAAALVLILRHLTGGPRPEVLISRGELIQIGGGFRIPEILEASGARLREVGTTNQTTLDDYARALSPATGMILKVHRSNFFMSGFVDSPSTIELARLAADARVPLVEDLGSGALIDTARLPGTGHEPTPAEVLKQGVDLVCYSGDKLFGGPQAGIIAGRAEQVAALKRDPLFRALRCDKLTLVALQATVDLYLAGDGAPAADHGTDPWTTVPVLALARTDLDGLQQRALALQRAVADLPLDVAIGRHDGRMGGGTLPQSALPSVTLDLHPRTVPLETFAARLRSHAVPVIGYLMEDRLRLDLRTIFPHQDPEVIRALQAAAR